MTPHQITLVQDSFSHALADGDALAAAFYARLFVLAPETRRLFVNDLHAQGRKLVMMLASVVDGLERLDDIVPAARELAIRHVRYGALPRHYDLVGQALLDTLRLRLGARFDGATEAAWAAAYTLLADTMIDAARRAA